MDSIVVQRALQSPGKGEIGTLALGVLQDHSIRIRWNPGARRGGPPARKQSFAVNRCSPQQSTQARFCPLPPPRCGRPTSQRPLERVRTPPDQVFGRVRALCACPMPCASYQRVGDCIAEEFAAGPAVLCREPSGMQSRLPHRPGSLAESDHKKKWGKRTRDERHRRR